MTVALAPFRVLWFPDQGGHAWVYLNWALGLQAAGCEVVWLDSFRRGETPGEALRRLTELHCSLRTLGFSGRIALLPGPQDDPSFEPVHEGIARHAITWEEAAGQSDLLVSFYYHLPQAIVSRFPRSALVDVDPGLFQIWVSEGQLRIATYDEYFTIGETVGHAGALFPSCGLRWSYTPPAVHLPAWPALPPIPSAPYTTVSNWWSGWELFRGEAFNNEKRTSFLDYVELPSQVGVPLELALVLPSDDHGERAGLERRGWRVRSAQEVSSTPTAYRTYIQHSRGEFSCAKPSCMKLANAWISDRTLCYLASGRPAIVQHTGRSRFLPDAQGLFRFRSLEEAKRAIQRVESDYAFQAEEARALAEEYFEARSVAKHLLERALSPRGASAA